ncbi:fimbrial protein [Mesorhizobium xinjiangense]|uniref:fimbrial protein n=1 Tax=Mesorhizobium xinjiangense TaxID=2678685 RepID=UPI0012ED408D|nr:fimbrial protein [Mesorhizobium xinjiangense]
MTQADIDRDGEEKPLDPAMERVRRKMVRLLVISIGIMMVGLMAVLAAIVYKAASGDEAPAQAPAAIPVTPGEGIAQGTIRLPQGARVVSQSVAGGAISLNVELEDGGRAILIYDMAADRIVGRYDIVTQGE